VDRRFKRHFAFTEAHPQMADSIMSTTRNYISKLSLYPRHEGGLAWAGAAISNASDTIVEARYISSR
jgi:hypothetical protein